MGHLGGLWEHIGGSLGRLEGVLGASWERLEASWDHLGASWRHLGTCLGPLEASRRRLGDVWACLLYTSDAADE